MQMTEDGFKPFVLNGIEFNAHIVNQDLRSNSAEAETRNLDFYLSLVLLEIELRQLLGEVRETMRLAGIETDETARTIYLNSKMPVNLKTADSQAILRIIPTDGRVTN